MVLVTGRALLCYSHKLRLPIVIILRLFYFLMTNIWAIAGIIFYIKANESSVIYNLVGSSVQSSDDSLNHYLLRNILYVRERVIENSVSD